MRLEEVKKLADLARIDMSEEEMIEIAKDFDPILAYVGQVQDAIKEFGDIESKEKMFLYNVTREDEVKNEKMQYTEKVLENAPARENNYIKVKQIL